MADQQPASGLLQNGATKRTNYGVISETCNHDEHIIQNTDSGQKSVAFASRWYIVFVYSLASVLSNFLWASWGPISVSAKFVYGWNENTLFWVVNIGNISGFICGGLGCYLVDVKGLRISMILSSLLMLLTTTARVVTLHPATATVLIAIGQGLNGIGNSVIQSAPPVVSNTWFLAKERTLATGISALSAAVGGAVAFLFGPLTVSMPTMNGTYVLGNETDTSLIEHQLQRFNYIAFGVSALLFVCCIVFFPAKPSSAPSTTADTTRLDFKDGVLLLVKNPSVWLIGGVFALPLGFFGNWGSLLDVELGPFGIKQDEAGWIACYGSLSGVLAGLFVSWWVFGTIETIRPPFGLRVVLISRLSSYLD